METAILMLVAVQLTAFAVLAWIMLDKLREAQAILVADGERAKERRELVRQVQDMAERVASLRLRGMESSGDARFIPDGEDQVPEPYSPDLTDFLSAIEHPELRGHYEDQAQAMRGEGRPDEAILRTLSGEDESWL